MEVHIDHCPNCPSKWGEIHGHDPETLDMLGWPDRHLQVFPCAWRPEKLCRGICDLFGYDKEKHGEEIRKMIHSDI